MNIFMQKAIEQAVIAAGNGEVPIGAVMVKDGTIVSSAHNLVETNRDPTAHAEMLVIRETAQVTGNNRLSDCDLYVTLEPCAMCAQAISLAKIRRLYYGAYDLKGGAVENGARIFSHATCHHRPEIYGGISEKLCADMLTSFFQQKR